MRFLRHLAAVCLLVGVIVVAGLMWAHASGGYTDGAGPGPGEFIRFGPGGGSTPHDLANLIRTCEIEAALATVVVTIAVVRRRTRRRRAGSRTGAS